MNALVVPKDQIDQFRQEFLQELPILAREYIDTARAEATTAAFEKVMNTALKVIEGLEVEKKKDVYANLPVIHVSFGPGMQLATTVEPAPEAAPEDVTDVEAKPVKSPFGTSSRENWELPDDPTKLLEPVPVDPDDAATLAALNLAGSAMALDD